MGVPEISRNHPKLDPFRIDGFGDPPCSETPIFIPFNHPWIEGSSTQPLRSALRRRWQS